MKKIVAPLFLIGLIGCRNLPSETTSSIHQALAKAKAFSFINSDSIKYYDSILHLLVNKNNSTENALLKYCDGIYYLTTGLHNKAAIHFKEAAIVFEKEKNDSLLFNSYVALGNCNKLSGKPDEAILYYLKAIPPKETNINQNYFSICYANLAETYQQKTDVANAKRYIALAMQKEPYGSRNYVAMMHIAANLYGMTDVIDSALLTDYEGISLSFANNYPEKLSPFYDNIANCFFAQKKYDSAAYYFRKCIYIDSINGRMQLMADTYSQMVNLYAVQNNPEKMMLTAKYANNLCDSTQYLRGKYRIFEGLNNYYNSTQNWKSMSEVKDSLQHIYMQLINKETEAKIALYNIEYETSKKEQLIAAQQNNLQKSRYIAAFTSIVALLLGLSIFVIFKNYKTKQLIAVNHAIQQQKNNHVQAVFESEQTERIRIARDLHDSIGQKLSVIKIYLNNEKLDAAKTADLLDDTIQEVRNISHNLLPEELNFGLLAAIKSDIEKMKNAGIFKVNTTLEEAPYQNLSLPASLNIVRIFRELLSNLVKHSQATEIAINMFIKQSNFYLQLKDNGIGINSKEISNSKGIGWKNIFTRINMLKGKINIENTTPGTSIHIEIPIS